MATTTTNTIQIQMQDESGHNQTFNIDYPQSETTLASIKLALAPALATNSWCSSYGIPFIRVRSATIVETEKTKLSDESNVVTIIPTKATITTTTDTGSQNFVVEGMTIQGYSFQFLNGESSITPNLNQTSINKTENTITAVFYTPTAGTAYYNFIITSGVYTIAIPITVTKN